VSSGGKARASFRDSGCVFWDTRASASHASLRFRGRLRHVHDCLADVRALEQAEQSGADSARVYLFLIALDCVEHSSRHHGGFWIPVKIALV
jgi:hypothetical protein